MHKLLVSKEELDMLIYSTMWYHNYLKVAKNGLDDLKDELDLITTIQEKLEDAKEVWE